MSGFKKDNMSGEAELQNQLTGNERKAEAAAKITKWSAQQKAHSMAPVDVLIAGEALIAPVTPAATWWMEWAASQAVLSGPRPAPGRPRPEGGGGLRVPGPASTWVGRPRKSQKRFRESFLSKPKKQIRVPLSI